MTRITIQHLRQVTYQVTLEDDGSQTVHHVIVTPAHIAQYAPGADPERLLEASFEFLLQHEPKEAILSRFELPVIEQYFRDYPSTIRELITRSGRT